MRSIKSKKLRVLAYHTISNKKNFETQIKFLKNTYSILSGDEIISNSLVNKPIIITSDDGDLTFYTHAFPVLKKYKVPAILFVITDLINTQKPFWWDEIEYYLGKEAGNKKVWEVKNWSNENREKFLKDLKNSSGKPELKKEQLTPAQLKEMQEGGIMIANHSHTHPMFDRCTLEELNNEITHSTRILKGLGLSPYVFAYPNGNYSQQTEEVLKMFGVKTAFLFDHKINEVNINPLRISRLVVNDTTPMWKLKLILSGWHSKILPLSKGLAKLKKKL